MNFFTINPIMIASDNYQTLREPWQGVKDIRMIR